MTRFNQNRHLFVKESDLDEIHIVEEYQQSNEPNPPPSATWEPGDTDQQLWQMNTVKVQVNFGSAVTLYKSSHSNR